MIDKLSESGENVRFLYAVADMQGWRISKFLRLYYHIPDFFGLVQRRHSRNVLAMEDAHAAVLDLDGEGNDSTAFFAVYDGHGGEDISSTFVKSPDHLLLSR